MSLGTESLGIASLAVPSAGGASPDATAAGANLTGTSTISAGTAAGGGNAVVGGANLTGTSTISAGAATANSVAAGANLTGSGTIFAGSATGAQGTLTTNPIRRWPGGALAASESGISVFVNDEATGTLVASFANQTTDAYAVLTVTNGAIAIGTWYSLRRVHADGSRGEWKYQAQ